MASLKYWLWLTLLPKLGNRHKLQLLEHFASPENIYYAAPAELESVYPQLPKETAGVLEQKSLEEAEEILAQCREKKIGIITIDDGIYPDRLRNIFDPPILLYCRGHLPVLDEEAVIALVGTRRATPYGLDTAERLGFALDWHGGSIPLPLWGHCGPADRSWAFWAAALIGSILQKINIYMKMLRRGAHCSVNIRRERNPLQSIFLCETGSSAD